MTKCVCMCVHERVVETERGSPWCIQIQKHPQSPTQFFFYEKSVSEKHCENFLSGKTMDAEHNFKL